MEESKERRTYQDPKSLQRSNSTKPLKGSINRDIEKILEHSGTTPSKEEDDIQRIRKARAQIEKDA